MTLPATLAAPRVHQRLQDRLASEAGGLTEADVRALEPMGHRPEPVDGLAVAASVGRSGEARIGKLAPRVSERWGREPGRCEWQVDYGTSMPPTSP